MADRFLRGRTYPLAHVVLEVTRHEVVALAPPAGTHVAVVHVDRRAIRWTFGGDGANPLLPLPTQEIGVESSAGAEIEVFGQRELTTWRAIAAQNQPATIQVRFARLSGRVGQGPF